MWPSSSSSSSSVPQPFEHKELCKSTLSLDSTSSRKDCPRHCQSLAGMEDVDSEKHDPSDAAGDDPGANREKLPLSPLTPGDGEGNASAPSWQSVDGHNTEDGWYEPEADSGALALSASARIRVLAIGGEAPLLDICAEDVTWVRSDGARLVYFLRETCASKMPWTSCRLVQTTRTSIISTTLLPWTCTTSLSGVIPTNS